MFILQITKLGNELKHERTVSMIDHGLRHALHDIDLQHNLSLSQHLIALEKYTTPIELNAGHKLNDAGSEDQMGGLYFVESGLLKCDYDSSASLTRGTRGSRSLFVSPRLSSSTDSIGQLRARSATIGRAANALKKAPIANMNLSQTFRLARVGPGVSFVFHDDYISI